MVHQRIHKYLKDHGIRQVFVADQAGIDRSVFNLMLHGKRTIKADTLVKICNVLNISDLEMFRDDTA